MLVKELEALEIPVRIVELNAETVRDQARGGRHIFYGDVGDPEVLESLDVHEAEALVLTIPDEEAVLRALQTARRLAPELYIAVRTSFPTMGQRAAHLGADHVTVEEHAAANSLREALLERLGSELIGLQEISAELVNDEDWTEDEESATDVADRADDGEQPSAEAERASESASDDGAKDVESSNGEPRESSPTV